MGKLSCAVSHAEKPFLSPVALTDGDFFMELPKNPLILEHGKSRNQVAVAGAAGFHLFHRVLKLHHLTGFRQAFLIFRFALLAADKPDL